jgi:hypothetical protein
MAKIKWPQGSGKDLRKIREFCKTYNTELLNGHLLAIDPASRNMGWASFMSGELRDSGTVRVAGVAHRRLRDLYDELQSQFSEVPSVLAIEKIRGHGSSHILVWSVGVIQTALRAPLVYEVPISFWKVLAKADPNYCKSDEKDAEKIGQVLIAIAKEVRGG